MGKIYEQLSIEEWTMIQTQLEMGIRPAAIAVGLNRSESTLSRELCRNGWTRPKTRCGPGRPQVADGYRAEATVLARPQLETLRFQVSLDSPALKPISGQRKRIGSTRPTTSNGSFITHPAMSSPRHRRRSSGLTDLDLRLYN